MRSLHVCDKTKILIRRRFPSARFQRNNRQSDLGKAGAEKTKTTTHIDTQNGTTDTHRRTDQPTGKLFASGFNFCAYLSYGKLLFSCGKDFYFSCVCS